MKTTRLIILVLLLVFPSITHGQVRFLAFGDSITVGLFDDGVECPTSTSGGYPPELQRLLRNDGIDADVINYGLCGERTAEAMTRVEEVLQDDGDVLILMEGTNDISDPDISVEAIRFNLGAIAEKVVNAGVGLVSSTVLPRGPDDNVRGRNILLADNLRDDALLNNYVLADIHQTFTDVPGFFDTLFADPLHPTPRGYEFMAEAFVEPAQLAAAGGNCTPGICTENEFTMCLNNNRFEVSVDWEKPDGETGLGKAIELTDDTGYFWFFNSDNVEMVIKVLDACSLPSNKFWVFAGGLTNVGVVMRVVDTNSCTTKVYRNTLNVAFQPIQDTSAFDTCPNS